MKKQHTTYLHYVEVMSMKMIKTVHITYNRGHPKVNDSLRKFPYFSLD
jgi:hypothetical protein